MKGKNTLPEDVKRLCIEFVRSYEVRKKRYPKSLLYFDRRAMNAVKKAFDELGGDIADPKIQKEVQKKVYESVANRTPYRYLGETYCGESKFYKYRKEVFVRIAEKKLPQIVAAKGLSGGYLKSAFVNAKGDYSSAREKIREERDSAIAKLTESYLQGNEKDEEKYAKSIEALKRRYATVLASASASASPFIVTLKKTGK